MKTFDTLKIAVKNTNHKWAVFIALMTAACVFSLCFAGAIFADVQQEKDKPYALNVSAEGSKKITDSQIAQISRIEGVAAASAEVMLPVTLKAGNYSADLTVTGLRSDYMNETFKEGRAFPAGSAMPYIVLNEAACKLFSDGKSAFGGETKEADIKWLSTVFVLKTGEDKNVPAKICGILPDKTEDEQPLAFMDIKQAQALLTETGQIADSTAAVIRVKNSGYAKDVGEEVSKLGFTVANTNDEQQLKWDNSIKEADYLIALAVFAGVLILTLVWMWNKIFLLERANALPVGSKIKDIRRVLVCRTGLTVLCGIAAGVIFALFTPMFILPEDVEKTSFALYAPWWIVVISAMISLAGPMILTLKSVSKIYKHYA